MSRAAILCAGRGSYTEATLGSLPPDHEWVLQAEELRAGYDLPPLLGLDGADRFRPSVHLAPENASPLIWLISMLDAAAARERYDVVCVGGNSLGWYTSLAVGGALSFADGYRLVQTMGLLQSEQQRATRDGGQLLYPLVGDDWRRDPAREEAIANALAAAPGEAFPSIHLGGLAVLAGSEAGLAALQGALPKVQLGKNTYPFRLVQHGPYHTPLAEPVAAAARAQLGDLAFGAPRTTLVDGRGRRHTPSSADPDELRAYTLGAQVTDPFDFTATVRVALREHGPDHLVLPGPGNTLGGVVGQVLVAERWRGIADRAGFDAAHAGDEGVVVSMGR